MFLDFRRFLLQRNYLLISIVIIVISNYLQTVYCHGNDTALYAIKLSIMDKFSYFAYGSNMLAQRIHINNPTAIRIGPGKLNGFRLDFNGFSKRWDGCPSTVVPDVEEHVWGTLWQLNVSDLANLDRQEGVYKQIYSPFDANVTTIDDKKVSCRCYMLVNQPTKEVPLPPNRRPSKSYLDTMIRGANESRLPSDYLEFLNKIPDNGKDGPIMPWTQCQ